MCLSSVSLEVVAVEVASYWKPEHLANDLFINVLLSIDLVLLLLGLGSFTDCSTFKNPYDYVFG